ncbi:M13 family metallopeptidase [Cutibacterium sp.]|uniref:M13 family metallopeptidase n=1 Tax=Cutibacterium sp. TaxID=1912221 RepID=UPI0026DCC392|nr:M13-type metalloendopeptidase [Cutibacterium sp.]MDO4412169.1 M13-type metalloendopeptidase [Cutibacterium sp.]
MTSISLFSGLDPETPACQDFYRHVNGTWIAQAVIPEDRPADGPFYHLDDESRKAVHQILEDLASGKGDDIREEATEHEVEVAVELYRRYMDVDAVEKAGAEPLRPLFAEIDAISSIADLMAFLGKAARRGISGLFETEDESDPGDPTRKLLWIGQGGIGLSDESYYRDEDKAKIRDGYVRHIQASFELAGIPDAAQAARTVMDLETEIASHHWDRVRCRDLQAAYNPVTFTDVDKAHPGLHLDTWRSNANIPMKVVATLNIAQPSFFDGVETLLADERIEQWRIWATWQVIRSYSQFLSSDFVERNFDFYGRTLNGTVTLRPRWKRAVDFVQSAMGEAIGKMYVARHFPPASKQRMDELVANILAAYRESISQLEWMGEDTRKEALKKLANFRPKIGYPDSWRDFSGLQVGEGNLVDAVQDVSSFIVDYTIEKLGKPVDPDEWMMFPQTVNAYYHPLRNEIVFPAAILQPPFFDPDVDDAVNYGGIGTVIGHEIGHGFDDQGSTCDGKGLLRDWWTAEDRTAFEERTKGLIAQYNELIPLQLGPDGPHVNGELTIGENIGDLGGAGIAFKALQISFNGNEPEPVDGLTWQQRFFLSYASIWRGVMRDEAARRLIVIDPHSPNEFRCNQIVRNIDAFHDAFGITEDDPMWLAPEKRVTIW